MKKRILFVDEEPRVLEGLEDLLVRHRRKWDMGFVGGTDAALEQMRQAPVDVLVTDMHMPEMDGAALLKVVTEKYPETVRIVLSGQSEMEATMRTVPVAHQFLHKPCDADTLEKAVERACDLHLLTGNEEIRKVVGKLQRLPSLPSVYAALQRTLVEDKASAKDVARIVERDIGMSAKVLQLVNSAFFGLGRRITTIQDAVVYLGFGMVQKLVLATEVFGGRQLAAKSGISLDALRDHSVLTAGIAQKILSDDRKLTDDAWTAGLLHDIGKLVLAAEMPDHLAAATELGRKTGQSLWQAEQELYGISHAEVGAYLLGLWGLPYPLVEAVANHHRPERVQHPSLDVLTAVHLANALANECQHNGKAEPGVDLNSDYVGSLGLAERLPQWRENAKELACAKEMK